MASFASYRGSRDRTREYERRKKIELTPTTATEKLISTTKQTLTWREIDYKNAVTHYITMRNARHQLWLDFLTDTKAQPEFKFEDTKVSDFILKLRRVYDLQIPDADPSIANKTPDILLYDMSDGIIFLGDISVTNNYQMANQRKIEKYLPIRMFFEASGFRVVHNNFIIMDDLSNCHSKINEFYKLRIINRDINARVRVEEYHKAVDKIMNECATRNDNPAAFSEMLAHIDKISEDHGINLGIDYVPLSPYTPVHTEDELIQMIKEKAESMYDTYFDHGYESATNKFKELYARFVDRPHGPSKSTLKVIHNSKDVEAKTGYDLLMEYVNDMAYTTDELVGNFCANFFPKIEQVMLMKEGVKTGYKDEKYKHNGVYGPWQYKRRISHSGNYLTMDVNEKLLRGKKRPNEKTEPTTIDPIEYEQSIETIELMIDELGSQSAKPAFLSDDWDAQNETELDNTTMEYENYKIVKQSCGAQLGHSLSNLYQRLMHVRSVLSTKDNIYIPPNGSFICMIPNEHQPFNKSNSDVPLIFVTRKKRSSQARVSEYQLSFETEEYIYYVSKLCRLPLNKVAHWDQAGHRIVACASFLLNQSNALKSVARRVIGTVSILTLDLHQKTSELLDLLKYVSFMPFANISRLSALIEDKFDIMLKTNLDVWVIKEIESFMLRLGTEGNVKGIKERTKVFNGAVMTSSLGMKISIPGFCNKNENHDKIQDFIEEISMINIVRGKQFYGSQFMDKSIMLTAQWNNEFQDEVNKFGGWTEGNGEGSFPFESKFCFSSDAIYYAQKHREMVHPIPRNLAMKKLAKIEYDTYMHNVCTLRGCTKEKGRRKNISDLHTTSLDSCLEHYSYTAYDEQEARITHIANVTAHSSYIAQYSMSEKEQRGGGRPIATPTLYTKAMNVAIEKPEQAIGSYTDNNILVAGKHKLNTQSNTYKELLEDGFANKKRFIYQCTEDQSKFSENDNTRKYLTYIKTNKYISEDVKYLQHKCLEKMINREHLVKRMPTNLSNDATLSKYINMDGNGVRAIIGWPQGMLNNISTSIHSIADLWITHAFNKAYNYGICVKGLVHSDDSWFAIACNSEEEFKRYTVFRMLAKRMFCLKLNEKKLWGSKMLGELVSNFNINGEVLVPIGKIVANSFGNLLYQNWVMDVHNQVSTLQQVYRQGGILGTVIMLASILRQQLIGAYAVDPEVKALQAFLPIELGGYPSCSAFELAVAGVNAHYKTIYDYISRNRESDIAKIVLRALTLSMRYNVAKESIDVMDTITKNSKTDFTHLLSQSEIDDDDFSSVPIPKRGEVFSAFKHIMPKNRKVSKTVKKINELPFESDGLEMLVTRPNRLSVALGHLKAQTGTMLFELAADKYTSNKRRLAINQAIQATGKTIKIAGMMPMTMGEMLMFMNSLDHVPLGTMEHLEASFQDDTNIVDICNTIVNNSVISITNYDKRKVVNRMPDFEDKFQTIAPLRNVLLYIVDQADGTTHRIDEGLDVDSIDVLREDSERIRRRFCSYFMYYNVKYACNLIMQQYFSKIQPRLWMHPTLRRDDMQNFLEDLYGKTLNKRINYMVGVDHKKRGNTRTDHKMVQSLYTVAVLDEIYSKFKVQTINNLTPPDALRTIDPAFLSQSDLLKYAILYKIYCNDDKWLEHYDEKKEYVQTYERMQKKVNGSYVGDFSIVCRYGGTVMRIEGKPEDLKLTVNRPVVGDILMIMYLYVLRDHRDYRYNNPNSWHHNKFWQSKTYYSQLGLVCYGNNSTFIKPNVLIGDGVAIDINPRLRYPVILERKPGGVYELCDNLRTVYRVISEPGKESRIRVDNVKQGMDCPLADKIILHHDTIDGFIVQELLSTKMILHVTMRRTFNVPTAVVRQLLYNRVIETGNSAIVNTILQMLKKTKSSMSKIEIIEPMEDLTDIMIEPMTREQLVERYLDTEPEVLDAVELQYVYDDSEKIGAIVKHSDLYRFMCRCLYEPISPDHINGLLYYCIHCPQFVESVNEIVPIIEEEGAESLLELASNIPMDKELCYKVISSGLDTERPYKNITKDTIKQGASLLTKDVRTLAQEICDFVIKIAIGEVTNPIDDFFDN